MSGKSCFENSSLHTGLKKILSKQNCGLVSFANMPLACDCKIRLLKTIEETTEHMKGAQVCNFVVRKIQSGGGVGGNV